MGVASGWRCLDLGCGPRGAAHDLATRVGSSGKVVGLECNADFIAEARASAPKNVEIIEGNEHIQIWVGDRLWPRAEAKVSVFDSVVQGGDAVWEGLRIYNGRIFQLDAHLDRLFDSAKALAFDGCHGDRPWLVRGRL